MEHSVSQKLHSHKGMGLHNQKMSLQCGRLSQRCQIQPFTKFRLQDLGLQFVV